MAYAIKYQIQFTNIDGDSCNVDLLLKDYIGAITQLTGAADPFTLAYESGDNNIINPIRASECTINFYNDGLTPLTTFYSEDDEAWKIEFSVEPAIYPGSGHTLLWTGFLVQDDCREQFNDPPYQVQLKGTDNIALLKDVPFNEAWFSETVEVVNTLTYQQGASTIADGIITLGVTFLSSTLPVTGFLVGNSPYQDLAGFNLATNDDRWILKNTGTTGIEFHLTGTIDVTFTGFSENYRWILQVNDGTIWDLVPNGLVTVGVHNIFTIDSVFVLNPGERLFAMGASEGNFANDKTYGISTWTIVMPTGTVDTVIVDKMPLMSYIKFSILKTGLPLPLTTYINIYEDSEEDRGDNPEAEMLLQTHLFSGMFLNNDGTWKSCYEILEVIMFDLNATFIQYQSWQIIRFPELKIFNGTTYANRFDAGIYDVVESQGSYDQIFTIALGSNNYFINADATRGILRPYKSVKLTFNYEQPKALITGGDLRLLGAFDHSETIDAFRYDYYATPDIWSHLNGDTSQIVVVTEISTNTETERYIFQPTYGDEFRYLRFNYIEVSKGDIFDFHCSFRHSSATSQDDKFHVRFLLIKPDNTWMALHGMIKDENNYNYLRWAGFGGLPLPVPIDSVYVEYFIDGGSDDSQWIPFNLIDFQRGKFPLPEIPEDGCLLIELGGGNDPSPSLSDVEMLVKDIKLEFFYKVNQSTLIKGQTHLTSIDANPKNKLEEDIFIDDSPRSPIAGTLFTSALTNFQESINEIYFTKTKRWHRYLQTESRRLGEITTLEREIMQDRVRAKIDCTIKHWFGPVTWLSPLVLIRVDTLPGYNFILGVAELNYMQMTCNCTLWELYQTGEVDPALDYKFEYIYEQS
jgi:hypothetical protein